MIIIKRDKSKQEFDFTKIENAVKAAYKSCGKNNQVKIDEVIWTIKKNLENLDSETTVEKIQDVVENSLMKCGEYDIAKSYIIYREEHKNARLLKERIDYMSKYINSSENAATASETDSNANVSIKNVANLEGEVYKTLNRQIQRSWMKNRLNELYPEVANQYAQDIDSHIIYVHDEATSPVPKNYCMAASLYPLMMNGTGEIDGVTPTPPNDIQSFSGQVTNLVFLLSSQVKGAVALGEFFVALNFYVVKEFGEKWYNHLNDLTTSSVSNNSRTIKNSIRKGMKQFIYGISQPAGNRSYNSPFTNLNLFDSQYFAELFHEFVYPDGTKPEWKAIDTLQRIFLELHRELRLIKPLTFPVTTMCMVHNNNEILDKEYEELCAEELSKGSSFFIYLSDSATSISSCCRVRNELTDNTFSSTTGLTGVMTGSSNVITLNYNRIIQDWYKSFGLYATVGDESRLASPEFLGSLLVTDKKIQGFFRTYLTKILERVYKYHIAYKSLLYDLEDKGMFSSSNAGYIYTKKLYSTIGVIGYCEAAEFLGYKVGYNFPYIKFLQLILGIVQEQNKLHSIHDPKRPCIFNCEGIPGENLAVKFYNWDKADGYKVPEDQNLYSSYFFKQWDSNISVLDKLKLHGKEIAPYLSGGQACHIHLDSHPSKEQYLKLLDFNVKNGVSYTGFNIPISECKDCGHVVNQPINKCPICGGENIDYWIRIIGFLRPLSSYSEARYKEAKKRVLGHID